MADVINLPGGQAGRRPVIPDSTAEVIFDMDARMTDAVALASALVALVRPLREDEESPDDRAFRYVVEHLEAHLVALKGDYEKLLKATVVEDSAGRTRVAGCGPPPYRSDRARAFTNTWPSHTTPRVEQQANFQSEPSFYLRRDVLRLRRSLPGSTGALARGRRKGGERVLLGSMAGGITQEHPGSSVGGGGGAP